MTSFEIADSSKLLPIIPHLMQI